MHGEDQDLSCLRKLHISMSLCHFSRVLKVNDVKQNGVDKPTIADNFSVLKKCRNKLDCLIYEMLFIQDLKP